MGQGGRQQLHTRAVRSEKCVVLRGRAWGGNARDHSVFWPVRSLDTDRTWISFLPLLQKVRSIHKTRNQFYGRELYFWTLIVAMMICTVGSGMSMYEGISHLRHPHLIKDPTWNYVVLGLAVIFEGYSWSVAFREFRMGQRGRKKLWRAIHTSKHPTLFAVLFEDSAALLGELCAAESHFGRAQFGSHRHHPRHRSGVAGI
jgi:hypothetical protein